MHDAKSRLCWLQPTSSICPKFTLTRTFDCPYDKLHLRYRAHPHPIYVLLVIQGMRDANCHNPLVFIDVDLTLDQGR